MASAIRQSQERTVVGATLSSPRRARMRRALNALSVIILLTSAPAALAEGGARYGDPTDGAMLDDAGPSKPASGVLGYALLDLSTERLVARHQADEPLIPASVAKAPTALYALEALGPDFRFETQLLAKGPVDHGVLLGDLVLKGGGDPTLDTADLARLADALKAAGVVSIEGRFLYDVGDTPSFERIAARQPPEAAYNPGYAGLNLNFNRVLAEWRRTAAAGFIFTLSAPARGWRPEADVISAESAPGDAPGFELRQFERPTGPGLSAEKIEHWRIAERLLNRKGSRWLPVRRPARYAAGAFAKVAAAAGVTVPKPEPGRAPDGVSVIASVQSKPLSEILRGMLEHSTNVTAEAVGIAASRARGVLFNDPVDITASGDAMTQWLVTRFALNGEDVEQPFLENHSGLSTHSRLSARTLVKMFAKAAADPAFGEPFIDLLDRKPVSAAKGKKAAGGLPSAHIAAKTGTIFYGRALAGYLECETTGKRYAFAIQASDLDERAAFDAAFDPGKSGSPRKARLWLRQARGVERILLDDWTRAYCS